MGPLSHVLGQRNALHGHTGLGADNAHVNAPVNVLFAGRIDCVGDGCVKQWKNTFCLMYTSEKTWDVTLCIMVPTTIRLWLVCLVEASCLCVCKCEWYVYIDICLFMLFVWPVALTSLCFALCDPMLNRCISCCMLCWLILLCVCIFPFIHLSNCKCHRSCSPLTVLCILLV